MSNVLDRLEYQRAKAMEEIETLKNRIKRLDDKKEMLLSLPTVCTSCNGSGMERYTDAAGSGDWRQCLTCRGLGKIGPIECQCGKVIETDMVMVRRTNFPECPWCGKSLGGQYRLNF